MSTDHEVAYQIPGLLLVYKNGQVERLVGADIVPPSLHPKTKVQSKDIIISQETGLSARLYIPKITNPLQKIPLLIYFHGGAFCIESASSPTYHNYLNKLVFEANIVVVSVDYRRAPEHPLPIAYEDSWAAIQWASSHWDTKGPEVWLNNYVDFEKVFLGGDSAGGNIAHNMAIKAGVEELGCGFDFKLLGIVLVHPFFCGNEPIGAEAEKIERKKFGDRLWLFACPNPSSGCDDPLVNPGFDPKLSRLGCSRVLVCVGERDLLRERGWYYYELLGKCGWGGVREIMEIEGEDHVFHLFNPTCKKAVVMLKRLARFLNETN